MIYSSYINLGTILREEDEYKKTLIFLPPYDADYALARSALYLSARSNNSQSFSVSANNVTLNGKTSVPLPIVRNPAGRATAIG
jgi:hypothetical protein